MRLTRFMLLVVLAAGSSACSSMMFWRDNEPQAPVEPEADKSAAKAAAGGVKPKGGVGVEGDQELKIAKLWARLDEVEEEQFRQKERLRVLEKGMTLGLMPEELKGGVKAEKGHAGHTPAAAHVPRHAEPDADDAPALPPAGDDADDAAGEAEHPHKAPLAASGKADAAALSKADNEKYQAMLANAHDEYRAGRYGRAIVDYSALVKQFGSGIDNGMANYWIAKCWQSLKENNTARQLYIDFLKDHASSPWAPRAKLELARVDWQLGNSERAVQGLRELIQEHPYEDAAEMAKMELQNLDKKL